MHSPTLFHNSDSIRRRSLTRLLGAFSLLISLSACQVSEPQAMLEDYAARMSTVLDAEVSLSLNEAALAIPVFPSKRQRLVPTEELREGLWDVLDFRQCDMLSLISERNSSLGKVMLPSQKMRYELRFIVALQSCRKILDAIEEPDDTQLAFQTRLESIYQTKFGNLPAEIWNGIYGSDEISQHFKIGKPPLPLDMQGDSQSIYAMQQLAELATLGQSDSITLPRWLDDVEVPYETLHRSEFGANLLTSLVIMTQTLDRTAQAIEARLKAKPFCFPGHKPPRATVLYNVFQKFYAGKVQPYMAVIQRQGNPWFMLQDELMKQLPVTEDMQVYRQQVLGMDVDGSVWGQWIKARERHTKAWQAILGQCNMMPDAKRDIKS